MASKKTLEIARATGKSVREVEAAADKPKPKDADKPKDDKK